MREPRCIRYFSNYTKALLAREIIQSEGFEAEVVVHEIGSISVDRNGLPLKYKLYVERNEINKIAQVLANKLRNG